jgi:hypothetical protein
LPSLLCALLLASCGSSRALPPTIGDILDAGNHVVDSGDAKPIPDGCVQDDVAPSPDAQGLCGNMFLDITTDAPNLFFVLDRSGSMGERVDGRTKYDGVATAAVALVRSLGSQANVGAAVFPDPVSGDDTCDHGFIAYPATPGDPINQVYCGNDGMVTRNFSSAISLRAGEKPKGGTPTAATLSALLPALSALKGRTYVLLATDGGPNCNSSTTCNATKCIPNIERVTGCTDAVNCCDPALGGPSQCLDEDATKAAVLALFAAGIKTYVIGIPGSAPYAALLNELATIGGTARPGAATAYYDVAAIAELDGVLGSIGATVALSCQVRLAAPPPDSGLVNVYLDGTKVKYGPNGWLWGPLAGDASVEAASDPSDGGDEAGTSDATDESAAEAASPHTEIDLVGETCDMLKSGKYRRLQVVFGCATDIPR